MILEKERTMSNRVAWVVWLAGACLSCVPTDAGGAAWDCVEVPGYCLQNQICDSLTRRCERKCTEHPPRVCPEGTSCDYATGACRRWCKSDGRTTESICYDGADDDCDGLSDCADTDCDGLECGNGCVCGGGIRREAICNDGIDNNLDGLLDCADPNCAGVVCRKKQGPCDVEELCKPGSADCPANLFATAGTVCRQSVGACDVTDSCAGGTSACPDETKPDSMSCGNACVCKAGVTTETNCADRTDNDNDGAVDCADVSDCPTGAVCTQTNNTPGTCQATKTCG